MGVLLFAAAAVAFAVVGSAMQSRHAYAATSDVTITELSCDSSPEFVRIRNFGGSSQSLSGFSLQSDPSSQDYPLTDYASSIASGQTLTFYSGTNSAGLTYQITGSNIYRNGDSTDYARLVRPGASSVQINCGSVPVTPSPTISATPTKSPSPTPTQASHTPTSTPTPTITPTPTPATGTPTSTATPTQTAGPSPTPSIPLFGDADCSPGITIDDVKVVMRFFSGVISGLPCANLADVNCDDVSDLHDALALLIFMLLGQQTSAPVECPDIGSPT